MTDALAMWTVYASPADYPGKFVARKWLIERERVEPTEEIITAGDPDSIRLMMRDAGLVCLTRLPEDDPCIIETWI